MGYAPQCVLCCFPDPPRPIPYLFFCLGGGGFLSVSTVTSLQVSGMQSASALRKCGFSATALASLPQSTSVLVSVDFSEPTHPGCLGLLCSRLKPSGELQAGGGAWNKAPAEDKAQDRNMETRKEFQRNNCCKKPEEATGTARAGISLPDCKAVIAHRRELERQ